MAAGNVSSLYYPSSFPDQLRFNPNVSPDPINMATRFKLKPTPVILHKLNKPSNSHLSTPLSFETRMELASRLARRQLETSHESPLSKASLNNQCSSSTPHPLVTKAITATIATSVTKSTTNTKETTIGNIRPSNAAIMTSSHKPHNINNTRQRPRSVSFKEPSKTSRRSVVMATGEDSGIEVSESEEMERVNSDVRRLREELALKLRILPLTSSSSCTTTVIERDKKRKEDGSGRLEWVEEIDKERRREMRRNEEQTTRNARLLYQLQQKIKGAQRAISKASTGSHMTRKYFHAIQQLASAHRTAIRTLSALTTTPTNPKITQELVSLLELLSHISSQCNLSHSHEEEGQLILVIQELKEALNEEYLRAEEEKRQKEREEMESDRLMKNEVVKTIKKRKNLTPKMKSVLLKRSQPSPSKRPHPLPPNKPHPSNRPHPIKNTTPHFALPTRSVSIKQTPKQDINHATLSLTTPTREGPHVFTNTPPIDATPTIDVREVVRVPQQQKVNRQGWLEAQVCSQVDHINTVQEETLVKLNQLQEMVRNIKEPCPNNKPHPPEPCPSLELPHPFSKTQERGINELEKESTSSTDTIPPIENTIGITSTKGVEGPLYERMVARLDEIEKEKSEIQQRWKTISYDDPHSLTHPTPIPTTPLPTQSVMTPLHSDTVQSIMEYRDKYINYLKLSGANTEAGFDPWKLIDNICNELMDDMFSEVVGEIDTALEGCVLELYDEEFHHE